MLLIRSLGFGFAGAFAVMMTILLLYVMQSLISSGRKVMIWEAIETRTSSIPTDRTAFSILAAQDGQSIPVTR